MRVKIHQFLFGGALYSWAIVGQYIGRELLKLGHEVDFISLDKVNQKFVPEDLKSFVKNEPQGKYDMQISYTAMHNFPSRLNTVFGLHNRFGIYNYDGTVLPPEMIKYYKFTSKMFPSSGFSKEVLIKNKIPESHLKVIPHGINLSEFEIKEKYPLNTNKKIKFFLNIATPHLRKNFPNTLKAYGQAFSKEDDVCLVIKYTKDKKNRGQTVNFFEEIDKFRKNFSNAAEIEVIQGFIPNIVILYNACDVVLSMSNLEMFWLPGLEGLAANKLVLAPRYGGQLQYLNDQNSILIEGKIVRMPRQYLYFLNNSAFSTSFAEMFEPDIEDAAHKMKMVVKDYALLMNKMSSEISKTVQEYSWANVVQQIIKEVK